MFSLFVRSAKDSPSIVGKELVLFETGVDADDVGSSALTAAVGIQAKAAIIQIEAINFLVFIKRPPFLIVCSKKFFSKGGDRDADKRGRVNPKFCVTAVFG